MRGRRDARGLVTLRGRGDMRAPVSRRGQSSTCCEAGTHNETGEFGETVGSRAGQF